LAAASRGFSPFSAVDAGIIDNQMGSSVT
jgi:hypothetical protein